MRNIHMILLFALWMVVGSCFTGYVSTKQIMGVEQGMSKQEVQSMLGKPDFRRFDGDMEEWEFHRENGTPISAISTTIIIQFVNGTVVSMDTFKGYGGCHNPLPGGIAVTPAIIPSDPMYGRPTPDQEIRVMTDSEFDNFINKLKFTIMDDDQKRMINQMLNKHDVTSEQCVSIVKEISYTPDQVEMMKKLYPYVRNKGNFNKVIDILFSSVYKDEVRKFIKEYHEKNK